MEKHEERGEGEQSLLQAAVKCLLLFASNGGSDCKDKMAIDSP
jgi:hypothetical protein